MFYKTSSIKGAINETEAPLQGMKIKFLDDGSVWGRIYWLDVHKQTTYFTSAEAQKCVANNRFSMMKHVEKFGSSQVKITNLAPEIIGLTGFPSSSYVAASTDEGRRKYSKASLQLNYRTDSTETTCQSSSAVIPLVNNNKYYIRYEILQTAKVGSTQFYLGGDTVGGSVTSSGNAFSGKTISSTGTWTPVSGIFTSPHPSGNHKFRFDFDHGKTSGSMLFDGLIIIDLTKCFGSGEEPTQAWCDANIPYFRNTMTIDARSSGYRKWEFMLTHPKLSSTGYNRWTQTGSPSEAAPGGYTRISTSWTSHAGPLRTKTSSERIWDCDNVNASTWFVPIGQLKGWTTGTSSIPGADGSPQYEIELWVRLDKLNPSTQAQIYDGEIIGSYFYEL